MSKDKRGLSLTIVLEGPQCLKCRHQCCRKDKGNGSLQVDENNMIKILKC